MFISGYETPKYSTICRFIIKYQMQLKEVFKKILYIADDMGYINYNIIATDGTKIQANASKKFTGTIEGFKKISTKLDEKIKLAIEKHQSADDEIKREYWGNKKKRYKENKSKIDNFLNTAETEYTIRKKERKQNITDNDCKIMKGQGTYRESYNNQMSVDSKNAMIVANDVTNNSADYKCLVLKRILL